MKKVIRNTDFKSVEIRLTNDEKYYAWVYEHSGDSTKGFVSRDYIKYPWMDETSKYRARVLKSLTSGNVYDFGNHSLKVLLNDLIKANFTVYEFEDRNEFLKFLMD